MNACLFKFGQRPHIEQFRSGMLYMNTQKYFAEREDDAGLRTDPDEGLGFIHQPCVIQSLVVSWDDKQVDLAPHLTGALKGRRTDNQCNLFCMFNLTRIESDRPVIDPRNHGFGDSYIVVTNTQEFIDRVNRAAKTAGLDVECNLIEYVDIKSYSGEISPFQKSSEYAFQQEFRIAVYPGSTAPIHLQVGNLEDITSPVMPVSEITSLQAFCNEEPPPLSEELR